MKRGFGFAVAVLIVVAGGIYWGWRGVDQEVPTDPPPTTQLAPEPSPAPQAMQAPPSQPLTQAEEAKLFEDPRLKEACKRAFNPIVFKKFQPYFEKAQTHTLKVSDYPPEINYPKRLEAYYGKPLIPMIIEYKQLWQEACRNKRITDYQKLADMALILGMSFNRPVDEGNEHLSYEDVLHQNELNDFMPGLTEETEHSYVILIDDYLFQDWLQAEYDPEWKAFLAFRQKVYAQPWSRHTSWTCKPVGEFDFVAAMDELLAVERTWPRYQKESEALLEENWNDFGHLINNELPLCSCNLKSTYIDQFRVIMKQLEDRSEKHWINYREMLEFTFKYNPDFIHNCPL